MKVIKNNYYICFYLIMQLLTQINSYIKKENQNCSNFFLYIIYQNLQNYTLDMFEVIVIIRFVSIELLL